MTHSQRFLFSLVEAAVIIGMSMAFSSYNGRTTTVKRWSSLRIGQRQKHQQQHQHYQQPPSSMSSMTMMIPHLSSYCETMGPSSTTTISTRRYSSVMIHRHRNIIVPYPLTTTTAAALSPHHRRRHVASRILLFSTNNDNKSDDDSTTTATTKKRIVFLGTPEVAASSFSAIVADSRREDSLYEVAAVVTQPPKRRKRRGRPTPSPVGEMAETLGIPVLCPEKAKDASFLDELEHVIRPDLCITAAYGQYLPKRFLKIPPLGTINIHPSLLPKYRGASPVQRSLENGDNPLGVTLLYTVSKMDAGPVISQLTRPVSPDAPASEVLPFLFDVGTTDLIERVLPSVWDGSVTSREQEEEEATAAGMIKAEEGELHVGREGARVCHNRVRAFDMWPGTYMFFRCDEDDEAADPPVKVKIIQTRVAGEEGTCDPTTVVTMGKNKGEGLMVVCGDGSVLELLKVQPVTRKVMDAKSFVNGLQGKTLRWIDNAPDEEPKEENKKETTKDEIKGEENLSSETKKEDSNEEYGNLLIKNIF